MTSIYKSGRSTFMKKLRAKKARRMVAYHSGPVQGRFRGQSGVPDELYNTMAWSWPVTAYTPGTTTAALIFCGNGMFVPDVQAVVTTQPYGYDNLAALYGQYCVLSSTAYVTFENLQTGQSTAVFLMPSTNITAYASFDSARNDPKAGQVKIIGGSSLAVDTIRYMTGKASTAEMEGLPPATIRSDDTYSAAVSANPTNLWYWFIYFNSTNSINCKVSIKIVYRCRWSKRVNLALGT